MPPSGGVRGALTWLRAVLWYAPLIFLATALYGAVSLTLSLFDPTGRKQHRVAQAWARRLVRIAQLRVTVEGRENLILDRPAVMVANHLSYMDIPVLFSELPLQFRIMARKGLFSIPFMGWHLRRSGHLPVDHANVRASLQSLRKAAESVKNGMAAFVFPEGGRSTSGYLREFVSGAFFIALRAQAPVVPMVLIGTREALPPDSLHLRPGPVRLIIGPAIETAGLTVKDSEALSRRVHEYFEAVLTSHGVPLAPEPTPAVTEAHS